MEMKKRRARTNRHVKRDGRLPMREIRAIARQIAKELEVQRIILFGSYAYGTATQYSDLDLLAVMETSEKHSDLRYKIYSLLQDFPDPIDVIIRTPDEVRSVENSRDWFLKEILEKGRVLYGK